MYLFIDHGKRELVDDMPLTVHQFVDDRYGKLIGMHHHFYVMQDARQMLHAPQVARPAGRNAYQQGFFAPPYFLDIGIVDQRFQYAGDAAVVFRRNKNKFGGGDQHIFLQFADLVIAVADFQVHQRYQVGHNIFGSQDLLVLLGDLQGVAIRAVGAGNDRIHCMCFAC